MAHLHAAAFAAMPDALGSVDTNPDNQQAFNAKYGDCGLTPSIRRFPVLGAFDAVAMSRLMLCITARLPFLAAESMCRETVGHEYSNKQMLLNGRRCAQCRCR
jgi:hypothetical protein